MISIIIPVLNEADTIETLLDYLSENIADKAKTEIIIVDGESDDGTQECIRAYQGQTGLHITLISSKKGRAKQMNAGAGQANGNILYFLHADSFPRIDSTPLFELKSNREIQPDVSDLNLTTLIPY